MVIFDKSSDREGVWIVNVEAGVPVGAEKRGLLRSVVTGKRGKILQVQRSGDYLAFLDEGDPVYLPRDVLEWFDERQKAESFVERLTKPFRRKN